MVGVVETRYGRVRGVERRDVWVFSGVPYAASTAGDRRWRPPVAPDPWPGVRDCSSFGPSAPQLPPIPGMSVAGESLEQSEDCLNLNVWTPVPDRSARRPVMVWIHGGGFTSGAGSGNFYRGGVLARRGDVVVVTVNYRLGALGFLAHPALGPDADADPVWIGGTTWTGSGNWGLADQVAALCWVRDNIAAFGGDPGNVTVFGESAGAMSISTLLAVPSARGLFRRAVVQSGPPYAHSAAQGIVAAERICRKLGSSVDRRALTGIGSDRLVAAVQQVAAGLRFERGGGLPLPLLPVVDGGLVDRQPSEAVAAGTASDVSLLIGTNRDEAAFYGATDPSISGLDGTGLLRWVRRIVDSDITARRLVDEVRAARESRGEPVAPKDLWVAIATESVFRLPSLRLAGAHVAAGGAGGAGGSGGAGGAGGTWVYLFTWETPAFGGVFGACHALEIPFVFGTVRNPSVQHFTGSGDVAMALSDAMAGAWLGFATTGVPGGVDLGAWPSWEPEGRSTAVFGPWPDDSGVGRIVDGPRDAELRSLERALGAVGGSPTAV